MIDDDSQKPMKDQKGQFVVGHTGIGGRPKGSRNKLGEAFISDMYEAWRDNGPDVIKRVMKDDPATMLRSMVAILPKEVDVNVNKFDAMTDDDLRRQFLAALRDAAALGIDTGLAGAGNANTPAKAEPSQPLRPVH